MKKVFIQTNLDTLVYLDQETTHHLLNVLRQNIKEPVAFASKNGSWAYYIFDAKQENGESTWLRNESIQQENISKPPLVLIQCFLKGDKFDWVLQKTTELDVTAIYGVPSTYCVAQYTEQKLQVKKERWGKIIREASQQCGRSVIPEFVPIASFEKLNEQLDKWFPKIQKLLAYENENKTTLKEHLAKIPLDERGAAIFIGPEGGISPQEMLTLTSLGFVSVSLGDTILRAETAAIAGTAILNYERG